MPLSVGRESPIASTPCLSLSLQRAPRESPPRGPTFPLADFFPGYIWILSVAPTLSRGTRFSARMAKERESSALSHSFPPHIQYLPGYEGPPGPATPQDTAWKPGPGSTLHFPFPPPTWAWPGPGNHFPFPGGFLPDLLSTASDSLPLPPAFILLSALCIFPEPGGGGVGAQQLNEEKKGRREKEGVEEKAFLFPKQHPHS